jgi:arylsulfatase A-like enzyme
MKTMPQLQKILSCALCTAYLFCFIATTHASAKQTERHNILMLSIDDLNTWTQYLGHPTAITPNLDRLMARSKTFLNAHCAAPVCAASRNALMTGIAPHRSGWYGNYDQSGIVRNMPKVTHLFDHFRAHGYQTLAAGKLYHHWSAPDTSPDVTWDEYLSFPGVPKALLKNGDGYKGMLFYPFAETGSPIFRKLNSSSGVSLVGGPVKRKNIPHGEMFDESIAKWGVKQLKKARKQPFIMGLGFLRPHVPYIVPEKHFEHFPLADIQLPPDIDSKTWSNYPPYAKAMAYGMAKGGDDNAVKALGRTYAKQLIQSYLASIHFVDELVGQVLDALDQGPHAKNTIVVLFSDHGQNLGEKRTWRKMHLWETSTRVPLAIARPGESEKSISSPVSLLDLYPTLCSIANLEMPSHLMGRDLTPLLNGKDNWNEPVLVTWQYKNHALRSQSHSYIRYRDGREELFDMEKDPQQLNNIAKSHPEICSTFRNKLPKHDEIPVDQKSWSGDFLDERAQMFSQP